MALSPKAQELLFHIPIHWDPIPDWILDRFDDRILSEIVNLRLEVQKETLAVQMRGIERAQQLLGQYSKST